MTLLALLDPAIFSNLWRLFAFTCDVNEHNLLKTEFIKLKLDGSSRFKEHTLPLQFAKDLAAFEELIVELSRELYLADHKERKRAPRGFGNEFCLHLAQISGGSCELVLDNIIEQAGENEKLLNDVQWGTYFNRAKHLVLETIEHVSQKLPVPESFPPKLLVYFDSFGRSLIGEESFTFSTPEKPVQYNRQVRRHLTTLQGQSYTDAQSFLVYVVEVDAARERLTLEVYGTGAKFGSCSFPRNLFSDVMQAMNLYKERLEPAIVHCIARFSAVSESILGIEDIERIEVVDFAPVFKRLDYLKTLKSGWMEGEGKQIAPSLLDKFALKFALNWNDSPELPRLYPTLEGGLRAEWSTSEWETSLEIDLNSLEADFSSLNVNSDEEDAFKISLKDQLGWEDICRAVSKRHPKSIFYG